jgi:hypothetical protein
MPFDPGKSAGAKPNALSSARALSIFGGETLPDFIQLLFDRVEPGVKAPVVEVKYVPHRQKSENPVVAFHVDEQLLDAVADRDNNVPQEIHRIPPLENMAF